MPPERSVEDINRRIERVFTETVVSIEDSGNIVVIKTVKGAAQVVAAIIDDLDWPEMVGTIAGDDTIFAVVKPEDRTHDVMARLNRFRR